MKFSNVPTYTVSEIERKSRELLTREFGQELTIPIDAELILERMEGVFFDVWPGLSGNHCIIGMTCRDTSTGEICVFIDEELADDYRYHARYRMTVAEELGHVVLHREVINLVESPEDFVELQGHS